MVIAMRHGERVQVSGDFECVVDAAVGEIEYLLHHLRITGVDAVGRADAFGEIELGRQDVDADDFLRARFARGHDRRQSDAAQSDHRDHRTGSHFRTVEYCPGTRDDCAAE
jgi:hypothetical protein